ncbi:hypothetical protein [Bradyrhizobium sp. WD16]|uniref:hypothetical protein n=1 Tax=Bradyrhizobium sp. WD16 TaxID=1521768 RepID=UPI0020A3A499|nr:hypothetical protein [Bradyrhizobium sp. WD16]
MTAPHGAGRVSPAATPPGIASSTFSVFSYRLASVTEQVSLAVAAANATRFGLGRPEWRGLAALGS